MRKQWNGIVRNFSDCANMIANWDDGHYVAGHPSLVELEAKMTKMLKCPTILTNRGMTAIISVILALTENRSTIACSEDVYPGTRAHLQELEEQGRISVMFFDPTDASQLTDIIARQKKSFDKGQMPCPVKLVFTETFGNARQMRVADVGKLAGICADNRIPLVVDTTFTPLWFPSTEVMESGNVIIVGSMTKYHQDGDFAMGGYICSPENHLESIRATRFFGNCTMLPTTADYYLKVVGGTRQRYQIHCDNALALIYACRKHPAVSAVFYPDLQEHPQHAIVRRDFGGQGGGVLYLQLAGGEAAAIELANTLAAGRNGWNIAVSFGSRDWRVFPWIGEDLRQHAGCEGLVRISSGRGNVLDNIEAFRGALNSL